MSDAAPGSAGKPEVRRGLRQRLAGLSPVQRRAQSASITSLVNALPEWKQARAVMLYLALPDEVDTAELFARAFAEGKTVAVPRIIDPAARRMVPVHIHSLEEEKLQEAHFGIRVPLAEPEEVPAGQLDLVLVPGLGFSSRGDRIGRGLGYYDRFLAQAELRAVLCGLAFDVQMADALPVDRHDRPMDLVVAAGGVIRVGAA